MGCNGRPKVAEMPAALNWHVLRSSRSINYRKAIQIYIPTKRVSESIRWIVSNVVFTNPRMKKKPVKICENVLLDIFIYLNVDIFYPQSSHNGK